MMMARKLFKKDGVFSIDGKPAAFSVHKAMPVIFHESTETWSCPLLFGRAIKLSWHDLRIKIMRQLCENARARARLDYLTRINVEAKQKKIIGAKPMKIEDLVQ